MTAVLHCRRMTSSVSEWLNNGVAKTGAAMRKNHAGKLPRSTEMIQSGILP